MTQLQNLLRTSPRYIHLLQQVGIKDPKDFLLNFPRDYEDRWTLKILKNLDLESKLTQSTKWKIVEKKVLPRWSKKLYEICFQDETGATGYITFFNTYYQFKNVEKDKRYVITGKPKFDYGKISFNHPELKRTEAGEKIDSSKHHDMGRIYPVYSEAMGIKPAWFAKNTWKLMNKIPDFFSEYLPEEFLQKFGLMHVHKTIKNVHYPQSFTLQQSAIRRVFYDRLLRIQLHSLINKQEYEENAYHEQEIEINREVIKEIQQKLPFELTKAQKKCIKAIVEDLHKDKAMLRLLQGDVGSGKTVVVTIAAYYMVKHLGWQVCFLAPLSILAHQHCQKIAKLLLPLGVRVQLLAGSLSPAQKAKVKKDLASWRIDVIVGTHAILQKDVDFHNLQYVIIDEQHKFGVQQRGFFKQFGSPHIVQMSATPIPRSMALAFFGEFDVSVIDELPAGRKEIHTKIVAEREWKKLAPWMEQRVQKGEKVFIVAPLIQESEKLDWVKSATEAFHHTLELFPHMKNKVGLLHWKMKASEKDEIMKAFKDGKISILVSTTVIEVWVDIPEATIMVIYNAERFGLSQLHQLRWRIGRSDLQSYCFLETKKKSWDTYKRLKAMEDTNDWFKLAQLDLEYRGAGEILGTRQSGLTDIPLEILTDLSFMEKVHEGAEWLLEKYPNLDKVPKLKRFLEEKLPGMMV